MIRKLLASTAVATLVATGAASLEDTERAVTEALAPRWCRLGPMSVFALAGAERGMAGFLEALGPQFQALFRFLPEFTEQYGIRVNVDEAPFDQYRQRSLIEMQMAAIVDGAPPQLLPAFPPATKCTMPLQRRFRSLAAVVSTLRQPVRVPSL